MFQSAKARLLLCDGEKLELKAGDEIVSIR